MGVTALQGQKKALEINNYKLKNNNSLNTNHKRVNTFKLYAIAVHIQ